MLIEFQYMEGSPGTPPVYGGVPGAAHMAPNHSCACERSWCENAHRTMSTQAKIKPCFSNPYILKFSQWTPHKGLVIMGIPGTVSLGTNSTLWSLNAYLPQETKLIILAWNRDTFGLILSEDNRALKLTFPESLLAIWHHQSNNNTQESKWINPISCSWKLKWHYYLNR